MTDRNFDWTTILPEPERSKVRLAQKNDLVEFIGSFPTREEVERAGIEGRETLAKACAQVDAARIADLTAELRKLQDIIDSQADRILDLEAALAKSR